MFNALRPGTFGSVAKITGAADALLSGVAGHREEVRQKPKHVGEGLVQGGERAVARLRGRAEFAPADARSPRPRGAGRRAG